MKSLSAVALLLSVICCINTGANAQAPGILLSPSKTATAVVAPISRCPCRCIENGASEKCTQGCELMPCDDSTTILSPGDDAMCCETSTVPVPSSTPTNTSTTSPTISATTTPSFPAVSAALIVPETSSTPTATPTPSPTVSGTTTPSFTNADVPATLDATLATPTTSPTVSVTTASLPPQRGFNTAAPAEKNAEVLRTICVQFFTDAGFGCAQAEVVILPCGIVLIITTTGACVPPIDVFTNAYASLSSVPGFSSVFNPTSNVLDYDESPKVRVSTLRVLFQ